MYGEIATLGVPLDRKTGNGILNSILKGGEVGDNLGFELTAWDCLTVEDFKAGKSDSKYWERLNALESVVSEAGYVNVVKTTCVSSLDQAYDIYSKFTAQGLEGVVIKTTDFNWSSGTSKDCVKLKIEFECDLEVIGMTEGTGKAKGMMGSLTLGSKDGIIKTDCGTGFTDEARKAWWEQYSPEDIESYDIVVTVKANDIITKRDSESVSLFLPVFLEERLDKSEADTYYQCMKQLEAAKNGGKK